MQSKGLSAASIQWGAWAGAGMAAATAAKVTPLCHHCCGTNAEMTSFSILHAVFFPTLNNTFCNINSSRVILHLINLRMTLKASAFRVVFVCEIV